MSSDNVEPMSDQPRQESTPDDVSAIARGDRVYLGGYTGDLGRSVGVEGFVWTSEIGESLGLTEFAPLALPSPSYLTRHPTRPILYAVTETTPTEVHEIAIAEDGSLLAGSSLSLQGSGGCHVCFDETGRFLLVANYGDGSVSTVAVGSDGRLEREIETHHFHGHGPKADRQESAHAHQAIAFEGIVYVPDLGTDSIHRMRLDPEGHLSVAGDPLALPAGSGPRHLIVDEHHLVVACELSAELWLARRDQQDWQWIAAAPTSGVDQQSFPSALIGRGDDLFVANRGANTFSVFTLDRDADTLTMRAEVSTGGDWPRDLAVSGDRIWVANQNSDTVAAFTKTGFHAGGGADDADSEVWTLDFELPSPSPACIVLMPQTAH